MTMHAVSVVYEDSVKMVKRKADALSEPIKLAVKFCNGRVLVWRQGVPDPVYPESHYCEACKFWLRDERQLEDHLKKRKHREHLPEWKQVLLLLVLLMLLMLLLLLLTCLFACSLARSLI